MDTKILVKGRVYLNKHVIKSVYRFIAVFIVLTLIIAIAGGVVVVVLVLVIVLLASGKKKRTPAHVSDYGVPPIPDPISTPIQAPKLDRSNKICPSCGKETPVSSKFCGGCGYAFPVFGWLLIFTSFL